MGIFEQIFTYLFLELVSEGQIWGNLVLVTNIEKQSLSTALALGALGAVDGQPAKQRKPGPLWNFCFRRMWGRGGRQKYPPGSPLGEDEGRLLVAFPLWEHFRLTSKRWPRKKMVQWMLQPALLLSIRSRGNTSRATLSTSSASVCTSPKLRV